MSPTFSIGFLVILFLDPSWSAAPDCMIASLCCSDSERVLVRLGDAVDGADRPTTKDMEKKIFRSWKEIRREGGNWATEKPADLFGHEFASDAWYVWQRQGELSAGKSNTKIIIDATTDPMRIDFHDIINGETWVKPCIFKFDKGNLIIVEPTKPSGAVFTKNGKYEIRPTSFTCTKDNLYCKITLVECSFYDQ